MLSTLEEPQQQDVQFELPVGFVSLGVMVNNTDLATIVRLIESVRGGDKERPITYLEVGSWCGSSALAAASRSNVKVFCVDHWEGSPGDLTFLNSQEYGSEMVFRTFCRNIGDKLHRTVFPVHGFSVDVAKQWKLPLDFCFIDASHNFDSVIADIEAWKPFVKPGGILAGHDATFSFGVKRALKRYNVTAIEGDVWWMKIKG